MFHSGEFKDSPNLGLYDVSLDTDFLTSLSKCETTYQEQSVRAKKSYIPMEIVVVRNGHSIMHLHTPS